LSRAPRLAFLRGIRRRWFLALAFLAAVLSATSARAQDNYEIQVYGYELVDPGHTMVELHSNFTIDGSKATIDGVYPTNHAEHETIEITHELHRLVRVWFLHLHFGNRGPGMAVGGRSHSATRRRP
jgi:hypothetical protein